MCPCVTHEVRPGLSGVKCRWSRVYKHIWGEIKDANVVYILYIWTLDIHGFSSKRKNLIITLSCRWYKKSNSFPTKRKK